MIPAADVIGKAIGIDLEMGGHLVGDAVVQALVREGWRLVHPPEFTVNEGADGAVFKAEGVVDDQAVVLESEPIDLASIPEYMRPIITRAVEQQMGQAFVNTLGMLLGIDVPEVDEDEGQLPDTV